MPVMLVKPTDTSLLASANISPLTNIRGIEWSLRAFASMRAVRLFLRARAVIKSLLRAASTSENTDGEQRALRKFSASWNLSFKLKEKNVLRQVIWLTLPNSGQ